MSSFSLFEDPDLGGTRLGKGEENTHGMFASWNTSTDVSDGFKFQIRS